MTTWDVRDASGEVVNSLSGLSEALGVPPALAVKQLFANPVLIAAAPASLLRDVKAAARPKPGDGTPPPISTGSFVSFPGGKGRVDLTVSKGKVPGVEGDVEGTDKSPAARVVVWKDGKPTREKRAFSTHKLKRIAPLDKPEKKADPAATLVAMVAQHERRVSALRLPPERRVSGIAVKSAYDRGMAAWPGESKTSLSRTEWGLARAEHFVRVAAGDVGEKSRAGNDVDLLHPDHPLRQRDANKVYLDVNDVDATVRRLLESLD